MIIYRIMTHRFDQVNRRHERMVGRLLIENNQCVVLEDHAEIKSMFPSGPWSPELQDRLDRLGRNGYYEVVREDSIEAGVHPEHVPDLELGQSEPEAIFTLVGEGIAAPILIEVYGHAVLQAGRKLTDAETRDLMDKVRDGKYVLTPAGE